jgi:hypothetical protein
MFDSLDLSPSANSLALDVWALIQVFDDIEDGHAPKKDEAERALYASLVGLPANAFYRQHGAAIGPALLLMIEKWKAANIVEKGRAHDAKSYMWRAGFYDVLALICLCDGKRPQPALALYGESYEDYMKEFDHA